MRILALDIGEVRVGVAVCDPGERVASPVCVLPAREVTDNAKPFNRVLEDWEPELILSGLPYTLSGEEGPQARRRSAFARWPTPSPKTVAFPMNSQMSALARARPSAVCVKRA